MELESEDNTPENIWNDWFYNGPYLPPKSQIVFDILYLEIQGTIGFKRLLFEWLHVLIIIDM